LIYSFWAHDLPLLCLLWRFEATFGLASFLRKEREEAFWKGRKKEEEEESSPN
jgi:hypothetical protein